MRTTLDTAAVERLAVTGPITDLLLNARHALPHGANGRGPAPSNPRACQLRKDIGQQRSDPIGALFTIGECDLRDGVALCEVTAPLHALIAALETVAVAEQARRARPIPTLVRSQTKAAYLEQQAEHDVLEHPDSPAALEKLRQATARDIELLASIESECARELSVIRCGAPVTYGTRRGTLQAVR